VAAENGVWRELMPLVDLLEEEMRHRVAAMTAALELEEESLIQLVEAVADHEAGLVLFGSLDDGLKERLVEPLGRLESSRRAEIGRRAQELGVPDALGPLRSILTE
jgi:hypothetical protein